MLELTMITPWEYKKTKNGVAGLNILTDPQEIRIFFHDTFLRDSDDRFGNDGSYALTDQVYRDYLRCFHYSDGEEDPFEVEDRWILRSGETYCLADSIYPKILLGMILMAESDQGRPVFVNRFNDIALNFIVKRKEKYYAYLSCFADVYSIYSALDKEIDIRYPGHITLNGKPMTEDVVRSMDLSVDADMIRSSMEYVRDFNSNPWAVPEHYAEMELSAFIKGFSGNAHKGAGGWNVKIGSEELNRLDYIKYAPAYVVAENYDGERTFANERIYAGYEGLGQIIGEMIERSKENKNAMYAVYWDNMDEVDRTGDILKTVSVFVHLDCIEKTISIWDGKSIHGRERFYKALQGV